MRSKSGNRCQDQHPLYAVRVKLQLFVNSQDSQFLDSPVVLGRNFGGYHVVIFAHSISCHLEIMATWKERGEVPDSDDDGDLDDVESVYGLVDDACNDERLDDPPRDNETIVRNTDEIEPEGVRTQDDSETLGNINGQSLTLSDAPDSLHLILHEEEQGESAVNHVNPERSGHQNDEERTEGFVADLGLYTAPSTPKASPQNSFDAPFSPLWFEKDAQQGDDQLPDFLRADTATQDIDEKGSTSFVQLNAVVPSSPLGSLPSLSQLGAPSKAVRSPLEIAKSGRPVVEISRPPSPIYRQRTFRQRKQIQLHPYEIENQKFRQDWRLRGLPPLRIAESQEAPEAKHVRQNVQRSDQDVQDLDRRSSDDESQASSSIQQLPHSQEQSQPSEQAVDSISSSQALGLAQNESDDDEFPDVSDLLRVKISDHRHGIKRRAKTYSSKAKRHRTSTNLPRPNSQVPVGVAPRGLENPASPPMSSSPPRTAARRALSRVVSDASQSSTSIELPSFFRDEEQESLPTPATSSVRRPPAIIIPSDSEIELRAGSEDDGQTSDSSLQSNSSAKLMHMNGKKIKGVLPASHLRLGAQARRRSPSLPAVSATRRSLSPQPDRRGVAQRAYHKPQRKRTAGSSQKLGRLSDISDDDDDDEVTRRITNSARLSDKNTFLTESRIGIAEEGDSIDLMLPALKRHRSLNIRPAKKRRKTLQQQRVDSNVRQLKTTEHIEANVGRSQPKHMIYGKRTTKPHRLHKHARIAPAPPRLSVMDAIANSHEQVPPLFLRLAARIVRKRNDLGRHSPRRKFIKLATKEDTVDAQSVLQDWRDSKIRPSMLRGSTEAYISPQEILREISVNQQQSRLSSPSKRSASKASVFRAADHSLQPRKLLVARTAQLNIKNFVSSGQPAEHATTGTQTVYPKAATGQSLKPNLPRQQAIRPAQLEAEDRSAPSLTPRPRFQIAKGVLDKLFKDSHQKSQPQNNVPLSRFLADEDVLLMSTEKDSHAQGAETSHRHVKSTRHISEPNRRRKLIRPQQLDTGAAFYRQPSEHLQLEFSPRDSTVVQEDGQNKLQGLVYRPTYPVTFNVVPLHSGVFFHHSTFLGSGKLANHLKDAEIRHGHAAPLSLFLEETQLSWSTWTETVSSELGTCFDWVTDKMCGDHMDNQTFDSEPIISTLASVLTYLESHITFSSDLGVDHFLMRAITILSEFAATVEQIVVRVDEAMKLVEIFRLACLINLRVLLIARTSVLCSQKVLQIEEILKRFAQIYVRRMFDIGLDSLHAIYDKLQYLSYREHGLGTDQKILESWVVIIRIMDKAAIPRGSFWDVVNSVLHINKITACVDAALMECTWHKVFNLLPLFEFDNFGVLIAGQRHLKTSENWTMPQQMVKRVTELYTTNEKQLSGFKNYCRALINRCHHLMIEWGWWNCATITGTIFDFFARRNLAHLRHEESSISPQFLNELHNMDPSLAVETDDLCFHIFLKMVGLGIKHAAEVNNKKLARNLVTRLLPNHDRHFSKEEAILKSDLESLRNHHDLLCTLFWAAPKEFKPPLTLLQELVDFDRSHTQACKINFYAWEHICRFLATHHPDEDMISPLSEWHKSSLNTLWQQYSNTETEVRQQADDIFSKDANGITENQILEATKVNKDATRPILNMMLQAIAHVRNFNMKINVARHFFDLSRSQLLSPEHVTNGRLQDFWLSF